MARHFRPRRFLLFGAMFLALVVCTLVLSNIFQPLSPLEARLVGRWTESGAFAVVYSPDRKFWTSNGQFGGRWWIDEDGLKLRIWDTAGTGSRIPDLFSRARRRHSAPVDTWSIEFSEDDSRVALVIADDKVTLTRLLDP